MKNFIKLLFSESSEVSCGRLLSILAMIFALGWVTYLVLKHGALPEFVGITAFVAAPYGLTKTQEYLKSKNGA